MRHRLKRMSIGRVVVAGGALARDGGDVQEHRDGWSEDICVMTVRMTRDPGTRMAVLDAVYFLDKPADCASASQDFCMRVICNT